MLLEFKFLTERVQQGVKVELTENASVNPGQQTNLAWSSGYSAGLVVGMYASSRLDRTILCMSLSPQHWLIPGMDSRMLKKPRVCVTIKLK